MSATNPQELLNLWAREQLSTEMATGQMLQHLVVTYATLEVMRQKINGLQAQIDHLALSREVRSTTVSTKKPTSRK
jgi:hypothetical protein